MGYGAYDHTAYVANTASLRAAGFSSNFVHQERIQRGEVAAGCHDLMNVYQKIRESRDSDAHPNSRAVYVGMDVTGSMHNIPRVFQASLSPLMSMLIGNQYITDPQVMISAIGDGFSDRAPFQCGQFESDINIDNDLGRLFLEGNGGGSSEESYEYAAFMLARRVSCDCFEKRQERGYAFLFGDELSYDTLQGTRVMKVFGVESGDIDVQELFDEAKQKFDVFFCIPAGTSHFGSANLLRHWQGRLGANRVLQLSDPTAITGLIASAIAVAEGCDLSEVREHLSSPQLAGGAYSSTQVDSVVNALAPMGAPTEEARTRRRARSIIRS